MPRTYLDKWSALNAATHAAAAAASAAATAIEQVRHCTVHNQVVTVYDVATSSKTHRRVIYREQFVFRTWSRHVQTDDA